MAQPAPGPRGPERVIGREAVISSSSIEITVTGRVKGDISGPALTEAARAVDAASTVASRTLDGSQIRIKDVKKPYDPTTDGSMAWDPERVKNIRHPFSA